MVKISPSSENKAGIAFVPFRPLSRPALGVNLTKVCTYVLHAFNEDILLIILRHVGAAHFGHAHVGGMGAGDVKEETTHDLLHLRTVCKTLHACIQCLTTASAAFMQQRLIKLKFMLKSCSSSGMWRLTNLGGLGTAPMLHTLSVTGCLGFSIDAGLRSAPALHTLSLQDCHGLSSIDSQAFLPALHTLSLTLAACYGLICMDGLCSAPALHTLSLHGCMTSVS